MQLETDLEGLLRVANIDGNFKTESVCKAVKIMPKIKSTVEFFFSFK
jgi:hypothetical protein